MADGYYPEDGGEDSPTPKPAIKDDAPEDEGGETFLTPKSICGDAEVEPGDKHTFEVVKVYDDEVEWKKAKAEKPKEKPEPTMSEEIDMIASGKP